MRLRRACGVQPPYCLPVPAKDRGCHRCVSVNVLASRSASSWIRRSKMSYRFRPIANCSGVCCCSNRDIRRSRLPGFSFTRLRISSKSPVAMAEKIWCRAPFRIRSDTSSSCGVFSPERQTVAHPITSSSWSSPIPCASAPALSNARTMSMWPFAAAQCSGDVWSPVSFAFGSAPCSRSNRTASVCPSCATVCNPVQLPCGAAGLPLRIKAGLPSNNMRRVSKAPSVQASKKSLASPCSWCSIPDFNARQLEKPYSRARAVCTAASFARGSFRRNSCSRSFASFFRYSSEARSGSFESDIDTFLPVCARRPHLSGWKSGCLTDEMPSGWVQPFTRTVGRLPAFCARNYIAQKRFVKNTEAQQCKPLEFTIDDPIDSAIRRVQNRCSRVPSAASCRHVVVRGLALEFQEPDSWRSRNRLFVQVD